MSGVKAEMAPSNYPNGCEMGRLRPPQRSTGAV